MYIYSMSMSVGELLLRELRQRGALRAAGAHLGGRGDAGLPGGHGRHGGHGVQPRLLLRHPALRVPGGGEEYQGHLPLEHRREL